MTRMAALRSGPLRACRRMGGLCQTTPDLAATLKDSDKAANRSNSRSDQIECSVAKLTLTAARTAQEGVLRRVAAPGSDGSTR